MNMFYLNNPGLIFPVSIPDSVKNPEVTQKEIFAVIVRIVKEMCQGMEQLYIEDLDISELGGGLTNKLYLVRGLEEDLNLANLSEKKNKVKVLVRVNGPPESDILVNRTTENRISSMLSHNKIAPVYYGRFENGRVEEFYENANTLSYLEMRPTAEQIKVGSGECKSYAWSIASAIGSIHKLQVSDGISITNCDEEGEIFSKIDKWCELAGAYLLEENHKNVIDDIALWSGEDGEKFTLDVIKDEGLWLKTKLAPIPPEDRAKSDYKTMDVETTAKYFAREVTFTHLDCQSLNIMKSDAIWGENAVRLIDFEYAGHNPRALDLANTFCEVCKMNDLIPDYIAEELNAKEGRFYLDTYITTSFPEMKELQVSIGGEARYEEFLTEFRVEVDQHMMASHLVWAMWSIIQACISPIEFDYMKYGRLRMEGYYLKKEQMGSR